MSKTSFQSAEDSGKSLRELIDESQDTDGGEERLEESPEVTNEQPEEEAPSEEEPSQDAGGAEEEGEGNQAALPAFARFLREKGYDVSEEVQDEDLYSAVVERLEEQKKLAQEIENERKERERIAKELEEVRKSLSAPKPSEPEKKEPEKKQDDMWAPIEEPSHELLQYVEQDPDTGMYVSRQQYKNFGGDDAAQKLNDYQRKIRQRSKALLANPSAALSQALEEKVNSILSDRLSSYEEKLKGLDDVNRKASQVYEKRQEEAAREARINSFWAEREKDLIKFDSAGNPVRSLGGDFVPTEIGREFYEELAYIQDTLKVKDQEVAINTAWRNVSRGRQRAPEKETPVDTGAEKKRRFVERRSDESYGAPPVGGSQAEVPSGARRTALPSLMEVIKSDPEARRFLDG